MKGEEMDEGYTRTSCGIVSDIGMRVYDMRQWL